MLIKPDTGIDISHWQKGIKIANLSPRPRFAIIKASEGTNYQDDTTLDFSSQIRKLGIPLGFYHFWRSVDPVAQADFYIHQVNLAGGMERIPPVLDLEVDLTGQAAHVKRWLDRVELVTDIRPILYGNKGIFSKMGNPTWFKYYDIWTASYPFFPDRWDWVPPIYSVTTGRREIMWQYAATYAYPDSYPNRKIDTNIAIPEFLAEIGEVIPPTIVNGYQKVRRYNSDVHIWRGVASLKVTNNGGDLIRPSSFAGNVVINGDGWQSPAPYLPYSLAVSNGTSVQPNQRDYRPFINSRRDGSMVISGTDKANAYNLVSGTRYSVKAGLNAFVSSLDPEHITERHPRTAIGYTQDGRMIACVVDGRSTISAGITLYELANIMIEAGAWWALELDGGDSSIMLVDGIKKSNNGDPVNGVRTERATVNSVIFTTGENNMAIIGTAKSTTHELSVKTLHQVSGSSTLIRIPIGITVNVSEVWIAPATTSTNNINDMWVLVTYGSVTGWVGLKHLGVVYGIYTPSAVVPPPPPSTASIFITHTFTDSLAVKQTDGTIKNYNASFVVPNVEYKPQP